MLKIAFFFALLVTPALHEGRIRPLETIPQGAEYVVVETKDYSLLAGTPYLKAEGKQINYPTYGQLYAELLIYKLPFKWILIAAYFCSTLIFFWQKKLALSVLFGAFSIHTIYLVLRCYILARPPVSNMAETILYVPWIVAAIGLLFNKRSILTTVSSACASALLLFFAPASPRLECVQPVLDSQYWLTVHVLMIVGSYGILIFSGICAHLYLTKKHPHAKLEKVIIQTLYLGCALLICGTILGGVWAAESWGRFWDWDPKEAWAFISSGVYLITIHTYRFKKIAGKGLAIGAIIGLMAITFTWYGVNYILGSGLHSYGFGNGGEIYYYIYLIAESLFIAYSFLKKRLDKSGLKLED